MNKTEFFYKYTTSSSEMDYDERIKIERESIDPNPIDIGYGNRNLIIVMEECSELIQELISMQYGIGDRLSLIEETADVEQGLDYVKLICDISDNEINYDVSFDTEIVYNKATNPIVALSLLQQQISKYLRNKLSRKYDLIEAVKNVYISLEYIKYAYSIDKKEINKAMNVKLQRLVEVKQNDPSAIYQ